MTQTANSKQFSGLTFRYESGNPDYIGIGVLENTVGPHDHLTGKLIGFKALEGTYPEAITNPPFSWMGIYSIAFITDETNCEYAVGLDYDTYLAPTETMMTKVGDQEIDRYIVFQNLLYYQYCNATISFDPDPSTVGSSPFLRTE